MNKNVKEFAVRNDDLTIIVQCELYSRPEDLERVKADLNLQLVTNDRVITIPSHFRCIIASKSGEVVHL